MKSYFCSFVLLISFFSSMLFAKEQVDLVILGPNIVTMNQDRTIIYNGGIAILGEKICAIGKSSDIKAQYKGKETVKTEHSWLIPGLVNTHNHAPMILLRGLGGDQCLQDWLTKSIWPVEKVYGFDPEYIRDGMLLAGWEMALTGTTTHLTSYFLPHEQAKACKELGIRAVVCHGIVDSAPFLKGKTADDLLKSAENFLKTWQNDPLITPAISPHSLYLCSPETIRKAFDLAEKFQALVTIHLLETEKEKLELQQKYGMGPVQLLEQEDCLKPNLLVSHAIWVDETDLDLLSKRGVKIAHCAQSNMKLASGIMPIDPMLKKDLLISLGTDGAASNNSLDMFQEMDIAAKLHKVSTRDPDLCPAEKIFAMATIDGAKALGMDKKIGSLEAGKLADMVLLYSKTPSMCPIYDPYAHLVYAVKGHAVDSVLVHGKWVIRNKKLVNHSEDELFTKALEWEWKIKKTE